MAGNRKVEDFFEVILARWVLFLNFTEVHTLEELKVDLLLSFLVFGDVMHGVCSHALAAFLRRLFQT